MPYIEPSSIFQIMHNVPFDLDYDHTILFVNEETRDSYMEEHIVNNGSFLKFSYVRQNNSVRVPVSADALYDCNYCRFKNVNFANRWFYAFITNISYVSNDVAEVEYEIDDFQTWYYISDLGVSFVEREHVANDTVGLNTVPEDIPIGETVVQAYDNLYFGTGDKIQDNNWKCHITITPSGIAGLLGDWETEIHGNQLVTTQYSFDMLQEHLNGLNEWLNGRALEGSVVNQMTMYPKFFETLYESGASYNPGQYGIHRPTYFYQPTISEDFYEPNNNKLFTYPYTYLLVSNNQGIENEFKWENAPEGNVEFGINHYVGNGVSCELRPLDYETEGNRRISIPINNFPECSFFQNTGLPTIMDGIKGVLGAMVGSVGIMASSSSNSSSASTSTRGTSESNQDFSSYTKRTTYPIKKGSSSASVVRGTRNVSGTSSGTSDTDTESSGYKKSITYNPLTLADVPLDLLSTLGTSAQSKSVSSSGNLDVRWNTFGFSFYQMCIKPEYARIIDDYFTRFGYKVNRFKVPETDTRTQFNFVKTVKCVVNGNIPTGARENIKRIFDHGVTLWHTWNVGDYVTKNEIKIPN